MRSLGKDNQFKDYGHWLNPWAVRYITGPERLAHRHHQREYNNFAIVGTADSYHDIYKLVPWWTQMRLLAQTKWWRTEDRAWAEGFSEGARMARSIDGYVSTQTGFKQDIKGIENLLDLTRQLRNKVDEFEKELMLKAKYVDVSRRNIG